jgi:hypothetical protein
MIIDRSVVLKRRASPNFMLRDVQDNNLRRFGGEAAEPSSDFIWYFI